MPQGRKVIVWDDDMLAALVDGRAHGLSIEECAKRVGVYVHGVHAVAKQLGLNKRMNQGHWPGVLMKGHLQDADRGS